MDRYNPNIYIGLTKEEVKKRKKDNLVNHNTDIPTKSVSEIIYHNVFTLFNAINVIIALLILFVHSYKNLLFMGIVFCNTVISIIQELNSKRIIDKLSLIDSKKALVIREGKEERIDIDEIVLDDIIKYKNGNQVVVDSIVLKGTVEVDESFITGESNHVLKKRGDMILSGSFIVSGDAVCIVEHVGKDNYTYKISKEAKYIKQTYSVIMSTLKTIIKIISILIIPLGICLFIRQYNLDGNNISMAIVNTSAAVVAMIPEGLVLLTSTVLAVSVMRLGKKRVLVQDLYCIESLARVDTLCLDKTGTITDGQIEVSDVISLSNHDPYTVLSAIGDSLRDDNPTMEAIYKYFNNKHDYVEKNKVHFSSARKYSGVTFLKQGTYVLGAPDILLKTDKYNHYLDKYADYRVLVLMHSKYEFNNYDLPKYMTPVALLIMQDKIRYKANQTLSYFQNEGVDIKLISGDSSKTVISIAKRVGIKNIKCIDMTCVTSLDNIKEIVEEYNIFSRVMPDQKKEIILALKANNHTVAMTGDGVNDVLALKEADCSIVMANGSDAARNVSQIVLLDSNFDAVLKILQEGRRTINNIERSATLFLTKTSYATILTILFMFIPLRYPFQLIQLSLISAITIGIPSFILALEPNKNKIRGNFMINVISKSIPAALTIVIDVVFISLLSLLFNINTQEMSTMAVILVAFTGFVLLFKICYPFTKLRLLLYVGLITIFIILIIALHNLFDLVLLSFIKTILISILCVLDIGLFTNMTYLCEKKIFKYKDKFIRRKV